MTERAAAERTDPATSGNAPLDDVEPRKGTASGEAVEIAPPTAAASWQPEKMTGHTAVCLVFTLAYYLILILSNLFFARTLGDDLYGDYAFIMSAVILGSQVVLLGSEETTMRFVPWYVSSGAGRQISGLLRFFFTSTLVLCAVSIVFFWTLIFEEDATRVDASDFQRAVQLLGLVALCLPVYAATELGQKILRSFGMWTKSYVPSRVVSPIVTLGVVGIAVGLHLSLSVWTIPIAIAAGSATALVLQLALFHRARFFRFLSSRPQYEIKSWLSFSVPIMLSALMWKIITYGDIMMLEFLVSDEGMVGQYAAAQNATLLLSAVYIAVVTVTAPIISVAARTMGHDGLQSLLGRVIMTVFVFALPFCILIIVFRHQVMGLFGPDYLTATGVLVMLAAGLGINVTLGQSRTFLEYTGWPKLALAPTAAAAALNIILDAILIPLYGIDGAALATLIVLVGSALAWSVLLYREEGLLAWPSFRRVAWSD